MKVLMNPMKTFQNLRKSKGLTAEQKIELGPVIKPIVIWQLQPTVALQNLSGINIPAHERIILNQLHQGFPTNVVVGSRGTSKTAVTDVLWPGYHAVMFSKKKHVTLSSTGFRGGQLIFEDAIKWMTCGWDSQEIDARYMERCLKHENLMRRAPNFWQIDFDNGSSNLTVPTNDPDKIRGLRGHLLYIDEANFIDWRLVAEVAENFLTVGTDFEHGGANAELNQVFYTSTIDFSWRPFQELVNAAIRGMTRDMEASDAQRMGDSERYEELRRLGLNGYQYIYFDYTDCLIPPVITNRAGRQFKVNYPNPKIPLLDDVSGIPFSERDPSGGMLKKGQPVQYYKSYPIQKEKLEQKLYDGTSDEGSWLAEQRNIVETSTGDVYSFELVSKATCDGPHSIRQYKYCSTEYKELFQELQPDYISPVLWECSDPCVIGVDYAREADFAAFVVIRLGPCASGEYNYLTHHGQSKWSNVIWAEQHAHISHQQAREKIFELLARYNVAYHDEPWLDDPWKVCRGVGLDMRGGGGGVRDELAFINDTVVPDGRFRIYDPLDHDERMQAFASDPASKPMLDAIWPGPEANDRMVTYTVSQMEQSLLFVGKYLDKSFRPRGHNELNVGYDGVLGLAWQLRKLRQEPTATWRKFFIEGDTSKATNKKDYWAAYCYAAKQARAHIIRQTSIDDAPPAIGAVVARVNIGGGQHGRAQGTRDNFNRDRGYRRLY